MIQTRLKGMGEALITPFKEDESVDYDALMRLVDYQLAKVRFFSIYHTNISHKKAFCRNLLGYECQKLIFAHELYP